MKQKLTILFLPILLWFGCEKPVDEEDISPPTVRIISPATNSILTGVSKIEVEASDDIMVAEVDFLVDGRTIGSLQNEPWEIQWQTGFYLDGSSVIIQTIAKDAAGNQSKSDRVEVNISNEKGLIPTLHLPEDESFIINSHETQLVWSEIPYAHEYILLIYSNPNLTNVVFNTTTTDTSIVVAKQVEGRHYWKIRSGNGAGKYGDWSEVGSFYFGGTVTDIDGNIYKTITIDGVEWMADNLRTTRYRNGDLIPNITDNDEWTILTGGAWSYYDLDDSNKDPYGILYNWYAVNDNRNISPEGWHVATADEWDSMVTHLGGLTEAGGRIKEVGSEHWSRFNIGATNESGFTAVGGGQRLGYDGSFRLIRHYGYYLSATEFNSELAWYWKVQYDGHDVYKYKLDKHFGFSVRCVKD